MQYQIKERRRRNAGEAKTKTPAQTLETTHQMSKRKVLYVKLQVNIACTCSCEIFVNIHQ